MPMTLQKMHFIAAKNLKSDCRKRVLLQQKLGVPTDYIATHEGHEHFVIDFQPCH